MNVIAKGSTTFNGNVEITAYEGEGPIPWTVTKYNRGDIAMRLSPANPAAADANTLNKGFIDFTTPTDASRPDAQSWRPHPALGVAIPTARQNGPVNWGDGEGDLYPTVAISAASAGPGYDMVNGSFGTGQLDINLGRAGTHASSPEANFSFSVAWFPYDAGWIAGNIGNPADVTTGRPQWNGPDQHAAGLSAGLMTWAIPPAPPGTDYGGLGTLRLPGIDAETNGMIFTTSSHGNSDVNIIGVAPTNDPGGSSGWIITIREDSALTGDEVASAGQFQFEFVYVPYTAQNLIGGYINGTTGAKIKSAGTFTVTRTGTGTYEVAIPGKSATNGTFVLQAVGFEPGTALPMATRAFLSYQFNSGTGNFVIQSRKATTDTVSDLVDVNFYLAWVDFQSPLSPPAGPRMRAKDAVPVSDPTVISAKEGNLAINTDQPEVLVTTIDQLNSGGYVDPTSNSNLAQQVLIGYFCDPQTLATNRGPFFIMGNANGQITRHDVKYNPVSHQYDVVGCARTYTANATDVLMISRVNPNSIAGTNDPLVNVFVYDGLSNSFATPLSYDDVSIAVSSKNGNFVVVAEHKEDSPSGEGAYGALFAPNGTVLTVPKKLDLLQPTGDVDDPDVVYLPKKDVFLFVANTDMSGGFANRIAGSVIQTTPASGQLQTSGAEQLLAANSGASQGHPASIENPFNGEIITAFDTGGNDVSTGQLSYYSVGAGPSYTFTQARSQIPYLAGSAGNPFKHQHPQLAADVNSGVMLVGYQARTNTAANSSGLPNAYVFSLLDTNGAMLPSQLGVPYFLTDSVGLIDTAVNYHNIKYDPFSDSFIAVFTANDPAGGNRVTYLASVRITSSHLPSPGLTIDRSGANVIITWSAGTLQEATSVTGLYNDVTPQPTSPYTVSATAPQKYYRLRL